jgi:hypothetical protein
MVVLARSPVPRVMLEKSGLQVQSLPASLWAEVRICQTSEDEPARLVLHLAAGPSWCRSP